MAIGVNEKMPILKANRLSTGITDLDMILEGGYFNPGNIALIGPSGMEKAAFSYHFAAAVGENENSYIVCAHSSPGDIISKASSMGLKLDKENVSFIDCYSSTLGKREDKERPRVKDVMGPGALNDISLVLNEAIKESDGKRMRVVFDTLSTFMLHNPEDSMRKFLSVIGGRLKSGQATTLYLVDEGVHDKHVISLIGHNMDDTYSLAEEAGKFVFKVPELGMPIPVRMGPAGITIV